MKRVLAMLAVMTIGALTACEESRLRVDRVEPDEGITGGGDQVNILVAGVQPGKTGVRVAFGSHVAEQVVIVSKDTINVVTPSSEKGPVDVVLDFDDGQSFKIPGGFRYVDAKETNDLRKAFFAGQRVPKKR
jgi:hypothetical protein